MNLSSYNIPFNDLRPVLADQRSKIDEAIKRVLDSGVLIQGPEVAACEKELAEYCGVKYCISCASGTDALILALLAIKNNSQFTEIVTVANTAPATIAAIGRAGLKPVFAEVDKRGLITPKGIMEKWHPDKTLGIMPVHLYGQIAYDIWDLPTLIIEDGAQALGSKEFCKHSSVGYCTSFYPTKNLGALGDGGAFLTNSANLYKRVSRLKNYGFVDTKIMSYANGTNSRLDEIQAAILRERLKDLELYCSVRRSLARLYDTILDESVKHRPYNESENYHLYTIRVPRYKREELVKYLQERGIQTMIHYPASINQHGVYADYSDLPETELFCMEVLSLPLYPGMPFIDVVTVAAHVNDFVFKNGLNE